MPKAKTGRKQKPHICSWNGKHVDGLYHCPDGRWRIVATGERYTEPDERLAVQKFRSWEARRGGLHTDFYVPLADPEAAQLIRRHGSNATGHVTVIEQFPTVHRIDAKADDPVTILKRIPEPVLANWLKDELITRPKYWAELTGIEQLGYWGDLPKPTPSPTLDEVGDLYHEKNPFKRPKWRNQSKAFWREFCASVDAKTLRELTQEMFADFKSDVMDAYASGRSETYVGHRFGQVKTIIAYSKEWGLWAEDRVRALAFATILIPPSSTSLDPHPIEPAHFHALLNHADDQTQAMLLLALNCCMYGQEICDLFWTDFDFDKGVLIADRGKTGVVRVTVLWNRTIQALRKLPRVVDSLFLTDATKQPHNANTVGKLFRDLRTIAEVPNEVKFRDIRDGAYTASCEGKGVQFHHAMILSGQRTPGNPDNYVKRRPRIVEDACAAIESAYFG